MGNNILYSQPEAFEADVRKAAELSGAGEFIQKLEGGYQTVVGETGKRLSGGEKQKIALARAILKDADILIFVEATAHMDKESEGRVEQLIRDNFKDKTCLIISHKKKGLAGINRVIELEGGKIVGDREYP